MTSQLVTWDFTLKVGDDDELDSLKTFLSDLCKKWCFQQERGDETGYLHWQGRISLKVKLRLHGLKNLFDNEGWHSVHLSPTSITNRDNTFYVMKEDTRVAGPWRDATHIDLPSDYLHFTMLPWMQQVEASLHVRDWTYINILYDPEVEGLRKSSYMGYCMGRKVATYVPVCKDAKDICQYVCFSGPCQAYFFNINKGGIQSQALYDGIESIKDGMVYDTRYGRPPLLMNRPVIWVFCNTLPPYTALSPRKWKVWHYNKATMCLDDVTRTVFNNQ